MDVIHPESRRSSVHLGGFLGLELDLSISVAPCPAGSKRSVKDWVDRMRGTEAMVEGLNSGCLEVPQLPHPHLEPCGVSRAVFRLWSQVFMLSQSNCCCRTEEPTLALLLDFSSLLHSLRPLGSRAQEANWHLKLCGLGGGVPTWVRLPQLFPYTQHSARPRLRGSTILKATEI